MDITLYNNKSANNKIDKDIKKIKDISNVVLKEENSILSPKLLIQTNGINNIKNINYIYISDFKRYYFVNDIIFISDDIIELDCGIDVLNSYKNEIYKLKGVIARTDSFVDCFYTDDIYPTAEDSYAYCKLFGKSFSGNSYILITA